MINQSLQPKGITVTASLSRNFLTLLAESETTPDQKSVVQCIEKGIVTLQPAGIERIVLKGKAEAQKNPAWREVIELTQPAPASNSITTKVQQLQASSKASKALSWLRRTRDLANTALLAGILLTLLASGRSFNSAKSTYWEYKIEGVEDGLFELTMQELGAQGWEMTSARRAISGEDDSSRGLYEVIFRRPITAAEARRNLKAAEEGQAALAAESTQSLAEIRLSSVLRSQQAYLLENNQLANSFSQLDLGSFENEDDYVYNLTLVNDRTAQVTAIAKQPNLKSYISTVFVVGSSTETITCSSDKPSQEAPPAPTLAGTTPQCAEGSEAID